MQNVGLLKLELIAYGIKAGEGLPEHLSNPFGLVHLVLPDKVAVSVHHMQDSVPTPFRLMREKGKFYLEDEREKEKRIAVSWTAPLKAYNKETSSGLKVSDILTVHGGFIAVHPKGACRFGLAGLSCRYCGAFKDPSQHPPFSKRDLVEAIQIVLKEKSCDFVNLSSGRVETEDGGVEWLQSWVQEIRKHVNILISLDLVPPHHNRWIDQTYAMGVDAIYYDLDFFNPKEAKSEAELQEQNRRHLEALGYAVKIFPKGAVLSHVVIGLESVKESEKRIQELLERNVVPVPVYFPPYPESALAKDWQVVPKQAAAVYAHLFEKLIQYKNTPHWVQQLDVVVTPLEGRFFSSKSASFHLALRDFYQTAFGRNLRMSLIALRRRLRVQQLKNPVH